MSKENTAGLTVLNQYGPRAIPDGVIGSIKTAGAYNELSIEFSGKNVKEGSFGDNVFIPAGSLVIDAYLEVESVFSLGGTTPSIEIGTLGTAATNGISITEAKAEALGTSSLTSTIAGTWTTSLANHTYIGVVLAGTTPTITDAGKGRVVIRYIKV